MANFWNFFLRNSRFTFLVMGALILAGSYAVIAIPKESAPEVQVPVGVVTTLLPGAPATDVEALVTNEIERGLSGTLENVAEITSASREGVSSITVEFDANADIDESIDALKDRIDVIETQLPSNAEEPRVSEVDFVDQPILVLSVAGNQRDAQFTELANALEDELESVGGVSRVEITGVREREITVLADEEALLRFGLTTNDLEQALRSANTTFPVGSIVTDSISYSLVFEGDITSPEAIAAIPITTRGGSPVTVGDVADVNIGLAPAATQSRLSVSPEPSERAIGVNVYKQRGGDITQITTAVLDRVESLQGTGALLSGLTVYTVQDAGAQIRDDLLQLTRSGAQTVLLVMGLLFLAIGWREGLIAGTAIPLSFMIGFIGLYLSDNTINFISLFSLILGIGVLVDSGIVMVEGINKRMKDNPAGDKVAAARATVQEFAWPLTSGTLTTVSMFVGLFIVSGVTGQFIEAIPYTLVFVLLASLVVALGFLPLIAATFLHRRSATRIEQKQVALNHQLEEWYRARLTWVLERRSAKVGFLATIALGFIGSIALIPLGYVQVIFFEQADADFVFVDVTEPVGTVREATDVTLRRVEEELYDHTDVIEAFSVTVGAGNAFAGGGQNERLGSVFITLKDDRVRSSLTVMEELRADFAADTPDIDVEVSQPNNGPPTGAPIGVRVLGEDLDELSAIANRIEQLLVEIAGTANVRASTDTNSTEIVLELDRTRAARFGLTPQQVSGALRAAVFGNDATSITTLRDDLDVVVRLNLGDTSNPDPTRANWTDIDAVLDVAIATPSGDRVPLSNLVTTRLRESSTVINHDNQRRVITVSADTTPTGNVRNIIEQLRDEIDTELSIPPAVTIEYGGETDESDQAFQEMFLALVVGVLLMIGVLVLQFDSFRHTFYVLSILPFSLIGILTGLALTGSTLSFPSIMGFIALSGIVVNNSILLIDMMNLGRKRQPERAVREVVIDAAVSRLRPILLTSTATIIGMVPLLYTDEIWVPLATAIMFGLGFSIFITLLLIPIIYDKWPGTVRS